MTSIARNSRAPSPDTVAALPVGEDRLRALHRLIAGLSQTQMAWMSGYLAGLGGLTAPAAAEPAPAASITVLYGSQTGNARKIAETLGTRAKAQGQAVRVLSMADYRARDLEREGLLLIVVSTHGEGEPPDAARELHGFLFSRRAPRLESVEFAVLGLGDSSYEHFCKTARDFDERLTELGARRAISAHWCDVDFQPVAEQWSAQALKEIAERATPTPAAHRTAEILTLPGVTLPQTPCVDREHPSAAALIEHRRLTTDNAVGDVRHLGFAIDSAALAFTPGDALGVWVRNDPALVQDILGLTGLSAEASVRLGDDDLSLHDALTERLELTQLHPGVVHAWSSLSGDAALAALCEDAGRRRAYAAERQLIDLIAAHPARLSADALVQALKPLAPRLYSIASSQAERDDELALTLSVVRYAAQGRDRLGAASGFLADRLPLDETARVYVVENPGFRLPEDGDTPIIMIGAGTGIAPYRAFLQQRAADGARGRNWLVFGNRHFHRDFLYQLDWLAWRKAGLLHRTSLAFSRDGAERLYVQDRLREQGAEIYDWLERGAHLFVCGATAMGRAVHDALIDIVAGIGGQDIETASQTIEALLSQGRYHRDLY
ncbi:assimilatory sulfite reductase (NADPH) flavoprotein subunit [Thiocystis violascens]|uniref:Sulfite reductase [NADPH] flavoprotein alpha-component n=1 Tax=Thiocystis violascens (strain ATCC 17096 / DSM 198 / 6111) TaxID=765911 RepID=I3Y8U5_THIV6|nr:assimilatory sulfite reductase (NADPH) flavoprotein subunit [Thiocystis violascens]AFL73413.1 sulfite reductase (NADPH) flavoprotein, alpha-component [Thiocystis violascens DSM 198]